MAVDAAVAKAIRDVELAIMAGAVAASTAGGHQRKLTRRQTWVAGGRG